MPARLPCAVALAAWSAGGSSARRKVRIGTNPFTYRPWTERDPHTGEYYGGFFYEFYKQMQFHGDFDIELVPITDPMYFTDFGGITRDWIDKGLIDMGWDGMSEYAVVPGYVMTPIMFSQSTVILTRREHVKPTMWQVFEPFEDDLWWALFASAFFGAAAMIALRGAHASVGAADFVSGFPSFVYHTAAALLGGDEYDLYHSPPMGRLYRLGLLFLVLVTSATYTANLAAFLTKPTFRVHGPRTMEDLKSTSVCYRWSQYESFMTPFVGRLVLPPADMPMESYETWAREQLWAGACDAIAEVNSNAKHESLTYCGNMSLNPDISFIPSDTYNIMSANDTALFHEVSRAILKLRRSPAYPSIVTRTMRFGTSCSDAALASETPRISALQMGGVFIIFGACAASAVAVTAARRAYRGGARVGDVREEMQNEKLGTKLDRVLARLVAQDEKLDALRSSAPAGQSDSSAAVRPSALGLIVSDAADEPGTLRVRDPRGGPA